MKFVLTIETHENDAVQSRNDVAFILDGVARKLRSNTQVMDARIFDTCDQAIGSWSIVEEEVTPIWGTPVQPPKP